MIQQGFAKLSRNLLLVAIPLLFDLLSFFLGLFLHGFSGGSKMTLKVNLTVGLPSVSELLDRTLMANGVHIDLHGLSLTGLALLLPLLFLLFSAFLQGGFIGLLHDVAAGRRATLDRFFRHATHFFARFLVIQLVLIVGVLLAGTVLMLLLGLFGVLLFMISFLCMRILFVYFEFTVVADDISLGEALRRSREYFRNRIPETTTVIFANLLSSLLFALLINAIWTPPVFLLCMIAYDFIACGLQLALMLTLLKIREKSLPPLTGEETHRMP